MAHTCMDCGQECYCDMEDHHQPTPSDCSHQCDDDDDLDGVIGFHDQRQMELLLWRRM